MPPDPFLTSEAEREVKVEPRENHHQGNGEIFVLNLLIYFQNQGNIRNMNLRDIIFPTGAFEKLMSGERLLELSSARKWPRGSTVNMMS